MITASDLTSASERRPLAESNGKSGAALTRVTLSDGQTVVVKRFVQGEDLVMALSGDQQGREVELWERGLFELLPDGVGHAALAGWHEAAAGVLVMRDLGEAPLGWDHWLTRAECLRVVGAVAALHRGFAGRAPAGLAPLGAVVGLFEPSRLRPFAGWGLVDQALRGWQLFAEVAPGVVGQEVLRLAHDTSPLTRALERLTPTWLHGDLATVNLALEAEVGVTLIDWGMSTCGPGPLDIGRLLAGCAHVMELTPDEFGDAYLDEVSGLYDPPALRLGLLAGLVWLGWNKALDIVEHPDAAVRSRERAALIWWLNVAEQVFDEKLLTPSG